jgi:hypothetical protein
MLKGMSQQMVARINNYNFAAKNSAITFGKACTWPDAIKKEAQYQQFSAWHYINVPRNAGNINAQSCKKRCITQAVLFHRDQLSSSANKHEAMTALMFLGHWLGDLHQPMHVSFRSDLGGNKTSIKAVGEKCDNLHWLWDDCLISRQSTAKTLAKKHQYLLPRLSTISAANLTNWQQGTVYDWANESLLLAKAEGTKYCHLQGNTCVENTTTVTFSKQELDRLTQLVNVRMQQASVRLATILSQAL